jgi:hypothetical protein
MSFEVLRSPQRAALVVTNALGPGTWPSPESRFEILRSTVWSMAAPCRKVHINRVLNLALTTWQFLSDCTTVSEEALRAELREGLSALEEVGDLIELSGGYWAPATTRLVKLPKGGDHLLVGGVPTALLKVDRNALQFHGPHRHLARIPPDLALAVPMESFESWTRLPSNSLQDWARCLVESLELQPYSPSSAEVFEYYLPSASRPGVPQFRRWSDEVGNTTGTFLARRRRLYGAREYRLVEVRSGGIVSICELQDIDVRRLMYAQDLASGNPVRARCLRRRHPSEWLFTSELPRGEQRAFAAFGTLSIPENRSFERRWKFVRDEEIPLDMLRSLGVVLEQ